MHHTDFHLKEAIIQAPILHYPDPNKKYIVYTDASDDACGEQLSQEHDGTAFPVAFLLHTFTETQRKWSTTKKRPMESTTQSLIGITTYRVPTSLLKMIISH